MPMSLSRSSIQTFDMLSQSPTLFFQVDAVHQCNGTTKAFCSQVSDRQVAIFLDTDSSFTTRLLEDVRFLRDSLSSEENQTAALALQLRVAGYTVSVRKALGSNGLGQSCFSHLRHEFLLVRDGQEEHVVDLHFREQFSIPQPTNGYTEVLSSVPREYVGSLARLNFVVKVLCTEMAASFKAKGLPLPPWRRLQSMLSKWQPSRMLDIHFNQSNSSDGASDMHLSLSPASHNSCMDCTSITSTPGKYNTEPLRVQLGFP